MSISFDLKQVAFDMQKELNQLSNQFEFPKRGSISFTISKDHQFQIPLQNIGQNQTQNQQFNIQGQNNFQQYQGFQNQNANHNNNNYNKNNTAKPAKQKKSSIQNLIDINCTEIVEEVKVSKENDDIEKQISDSITKTNNNNDSSNYKINIQEISQNYMNSMDQFLTNLICTDPKKFNLDQQQTYKNNNEPNQNNHNQSENKWNCQGTIGFADYNKFMGNNSLSLNFAGGQNFNQSTNHNQYQNNNNNKQQQQFQSPNYSNLFPQKEQEQNTYDLNKLQQNYSQYQNQFNNNSNANFNFIDQTKQNEEFQYTNNHDNGNNTKNTQFYQNIQNQSEIINNNNHQQYQQQQLYNNNSHNLQGILGSQDFLAQLQNYQMSHDHFNSNISNKNNSNTINDQIVNQQKNQNTNKQASNDLSNLENQQIYFQQQIQQSAQRHNNDQDFENSINLFMPVLHKNNQLLQDKPNNNQFDLYQQQQQQQQQKYYQPPAQIDGDDEEEDEIQYQGVQNSAHNNENNSNKNQLQNHKFQQNFHINDIDSPNNKIQCQQNKAKIEINDNNNIKNQKLQNENSTNNGKKNGDNLNNDIKKQNKKIGEDTRLNTSHVPINMLNNLIRYMVPIYKNNIPCRCKEIEIKEQNQKCQRCQEFDTIQELKKHRCKNIQSFGQFWAHKRIRLISEHYFLIYGPFQIQNKNYRSDNNRQALYKCMPAFLDGVRNHKLFWKLI